MHNTGRGIPGIEKHRARRFPATPPRTLPRASSCEQQRWKLALGICVLILLVLLLAACSSSIEAVDVRTAEFDVPGEVEIIVDSGGGGILLRGEAGRTTVSITATLHSFAETDELAKEQVVDLEIEWELEDGRVMIDFVPPQAPAIGRGAFADLEILVPVDASATITTDDGRIEVSSIGGAIAASGRDDPIVVRDTAGFLLLNGIECDIVVDGAGGEAIFASTTEGSLSFRNVGGLIEAETQEGDIQYTGLPSGGSSRLVTHEGDLHVVLPADADLVIDASARHGLITVDLPLDGDLTGNAWTASLNDSSVAAHLELVATEGMISIEPWERSVP